MREKRRILDIYRITVQSAGKDAVLAPLYYLAEGIVPAAETLLYAGLFNEAGKFLAGGGKKEWLWAFVGMLAGLALLRGIITCVGSLAINAGVYEKLTAFLKEKLAEKCAGLSLLDFEDAKICSQCQRAEECVKKEQIGAVYMTSIVLISCGVSGAASALVLSSYSVWIVPMALLSVLPFFAGYRLLGEKFYQLKKEQTPARRKADYFWETLTAPRSVRELRVNGAAAYIEEKWRKQNRKMEKEMYRFRCREAAYTLACSCLQAGGMGVSIGLTFYLSVKGLITLGEFGACIYAYSRLQSTAREFFSQYGRFQEMLHFAEDYFSFIERKEERRGGEKLDHFPEEIVLDNVSFRYPGGKNMAVDGIHLTIRKGESIAVVGRNGSGKTTLTRLLSGLYEPDQGRILYGGKELKQLNQETVRRQISMVTQQFVRYFLTLRENVAISDIGRIDCSQKILQCLHDAGMEADLDDLEKMAGAEAGGREFSGGQWQRIAIARAMFRKAELFLLDEPTSALDPVLESEILQQFLTVLKEKTCLLVSHRVGLCRYVDKIVVMKDGKAVEIGSHQELWERKGEYWKIYHSQSQWYRA